jgi:hypothetical protein
MSYAFYDVRGFSSHADFVNGHLPYKGELKSYPLGDRRYSARHFRVRDDGRVDIYYLHRGMQDRFEKGELPESDTNWIKRRLIASVFPDNTVEFFNLGMGEAMLMSRVFDAWICHSKRRGGYVLSNKKGEAHPIFKGQRFKLGSLESVTPYEIQQRRVNRKLAVEAMKPYKEFIDVAPVMLGAMDVRGMWEVGVDLVKDACKRHNIDPTETYRVYHALPYRKVDDAFFDMIEKKHYVDAAIYFCLAHDVNGTRWALSRSEGPPTWTDNRVLHLKEVLRCRLNTHLAKDTYYKHNAFNLKSYEMGALPTSTWDLIITTDGAPVERVS